MEDNIESLVCMGFPDRELNREVLIKADNDISEAVTILTTSSYYRDEPPAPMETSPDAFIGPRTKEQAEQEQQQQQTVREKQVTEKAR